MTPESILNLDRIFSELARATLDAGTHCSLSKPAPVCDLTSAGVGQDLASRTQSAIATARIACVMPLGEGGGKIPYSLHERTPAWAKKVCMSDIFRGGLPPEGSKRMASFGIAKARKSAGKVGERAPIVALDVAARRANSWPASHSALRNVADLVPYTRNARTHSAEQVDQIARSIQRFGWTSAVLVDAGTSEIIAGHGRVLAAARLGIEAIPTIEAVGWSPAEVRAYRIADNKLALNAGWDEELLALEIADLQEQGFDLDLIGFSDEELAALNPDVGGGLTDPDAVPQPGPLPVSRAGDVWICGAHRVACGDSTTRVSVEAAMGGVYADACWTDPPYNVNYEGSAGKILNDAMDADSFVAFLLDAFAACFAVMKPGSACYVAHADTEGLAFRAAFKSAGFKLSGCLIWRKNALVLGRSPYQWQHEPILFGWKPGAAHRWYGNRKQTTIADLDGTVFGLNDDGSVTVRVADQSIVIRGTDLVAEPVEPTVIECARPAASGDHPTMKPTALISRMLRNSTRAGDVVLDLFGGSGSTMIACEQLGRHARLIELDPRFVDVIVKRWEEFTGDAATLEGSGETFAAVSARRYGGGQ